jgi:hypothetical protein
MVSKVVLYPMLNAPSRADLRSSTQPGPAIETLGKLTLMVNNKLTTIAARRKVILFFIIIYLWLVCRN